MVQRYRQCRQQKWQQTDAIEETTVGLARAGGVVVEALEAAGAIEAAGLGVKKAARHWRSSSMRTCMVKAELVVGLGSGGWQVWQGGGGAGGRSTYWQSDNSRQQWVGQ